MLIKKSEKIQKAEGIELSNQESFRSLREKENYKYLGILQVYTFKPAETNEKNEEKELQTNEEASRNQVL